MRRILFIAGFFAAGSLLVTGCAFMNDFTTLFNIYYNANRIMNEVEEPQDTTNAVMLKQPASTPQVQQHSAPVISPAKSEIPEYYEELIRHPIFDAAQKLNDQLPKGPLVAKKLDSVVMKCSKILKFHSTSTYVPNALFLMAKANYYKGNLKDYLLSKQECDEFIATFPDNDLYVDAHLLLAQNLIAMKEDEDAHRALSRCIDIALPHKRYDVVSKALRYTADLALKHGDFQSAIDPYLHAMMLTHNDDANTGWQLEVGLLELETQHFADADQSFQNVFKYDPDTYPSYEAKYGQGIALRELGKYDSANALFTWLRDKGKYSDWKGYSEFELATDTWAEGNTEKAADDYTRIDTSNKGTELSSRAEFEYAMRAMANEDYGAAAKEFDKASKTFVPYAKSAKDYATILSIGSTDSRDIIQLQSTLEHGNGTLTGTNSLRGNIDSLQQAQPGRTGAGGVDTALRPTFALPDSLITLNKQFVPLPVPPAVSKQSMDTAHSAQSTTKPNTPLTTSDSLKNISQSITLSDSARAVRDSLVNLKHIRDSLQAVETVRKQQTLLDTTKNRLAARFYDLGRMFYLLGKKDSMVAYYQRALEVGAPGILSRERFIHIPYTLWIMDCIRTVWIR